MNFDSVENMLRGAEEMGLPLWACIMRADCEESGRSEEQSLAEMRKRLAAMRSAPASILPIKSPLMDLPASTWVFIFSAAPPTRPLGERCCGS